jgi:plastocyanin
MISRSFLSRMLLLAAVAASVALVLVACGGSSSGGGGASPTPTATGTGGAAAVSIADFAFKPQTLTVQVGTTVTWTNDDSVAHTVVSTDGMATDANTIGLFASGTLAPGQSFSFTFDEPGTHFYECSIHASMATMHGKVVVK